MLFFLDGIARLEGDGSGHFLWIARLMIVHRFRRVNESRDFLDT
jgi:hypothetical protein